MSMRTYGRKAIGKALPKRKAEDSDGDEQRKRAKVTPPPTKLPRDLSEIFDEFSVPEATSASVSPVKLAKRMLGRSKTESSIDSTSPGPSSQRRTPSLPTILSPSPKRPVLPPPSRPNISKQTSLTTKRTYAGSRSFLVALPVEASASQDDESAPRESYSSLRERWGIDMSEDDPYYVASPTRSGSQSNNSTPSSSPTKPKLKPAKSSRPTLNPLKSMTELRHKGETRRFMDQVGYLLEGLDKDAGIGLRRTSALDITKQLCDPEFSRKAKAADFIGQTWDSFMECEAGNGSDTLFDIIFAFFACIISSDASALNDVARRSNQPSTSGPQTSQFANTLFRILETITPDKDPLAILSANAPEVALRKLGLKKTDQTLLKTIHSSILSASLFPKETPLTTSLLVTTALCSLSSSVLCTSQLPVLLGSLRLHIQPASDTNFDTSHNLLRLLDTYLLRQWTVAPNDQSREVLEDVRDEWLLDGLIMFAVKCEKQDDSKPTHPCFDMLFRVMVSLTHGDKAWCREVLKHECGTLFIMRTISRTDRARHSIRHKSSVSNGTLKTRIKNGMAKMKVKQESDVENDVDDAVPARLLDQLCLALGLFTNLVQEDDRAKDVLRELVLDPTCKGCLSRCVCPEPTSALNILVQVYLHQLELPHRKIKVESESEDSADTSFLLGHLSVLLGLLMKGSEDNRVVILDRLGEKELLDGMVENAEELANFYGVISRKGEWSKGVGVASDVVLTLKELRASI